MKAFLMDYRQSPRKVRLVGDAIVGKSATAALDTLNFMVKRGAHPMHKLLSSAVANAKKQGVAVENLMVKSVQVNAGTVLKRIMPRARGSAAQILKRTSHVAIELATAVPKVKKAKKVAANAKS